MASPCRSAFVLPGLIALLVFTGAAYAAEVRVAVAANFAGPLARIVPGFERATGHKTLVSPGSTGQLEAQIANGAPFEVLLAADAETPVRLVRAGHALESSRFTYAVGRLVLWSPEPGLIDGAGDVLKRASFARLAIANPRLAPYGRAAFETLHALGVFNTLQLKLVQGENITQTLQFVTSGNARLGFVALSQVIRDGRIEGSSWTVPATLHTPLRQDAVLLVRGRDNPAARALLAWLRGTEARAEIQSFGYAT